MSDPGSPTRGSPASRLLLAAGTAALLLGLLEVAARLYYRGRDARLSDVVEAKRPASGRLRLADLIEPAPFEGAVYTLRPNVRGTHLGKPYASNAHGMRWREIEIEKPPGAVRIALIGDSHAFGWGVAIEDSFAARLEDELDGDHASPTVELLNFGVPGYNSAMEAALLEHRVLAFEPDVVLIQFCENDYELPNFLLEPPPPQASYLLRWIRERLRRSEERDLAPRDALLHPREWAERSGVDTGTPGWLRDPERLPAEYAGMVGEAAVERALERMRDLCRRAGATFVFVDYLVPGPGLLGSPDGAWKDGANPHARACAERLGAVVIATAVELRDSLRAERRPVADVVLGRGDPHPNERGHEIIARILARGLRRSGVLGERGGNPR